MFGLKIMQLNELKRDKRDEILANLSRRERFNAYLWLLQAVLGVSFALFTIVNDLVGWVDWPPFVFNWSIYGVLVLAAGVANVFVARSAFKRARELVQHAPNVVERYRRRRQVLLIILLYNIFFGFGILLRIVPSVIDFRNRAYVLSQRASLEPEGRE